MNKQRKICPVCQIFTLGEKSNSTRRKNSFKTCGSKECSSISRFQHMPKEIKRWTRNISIYSGSNLCDYGCEKQAKFLFSNGKYCCCNIATNCIFTRIEINNKIHENLDNTFDEFGVSGTMKRVQKTTETKKNTIDEFGKNSYDRYGEKMKEIIKNTIDENGRTTWSRCKLSDKDFHRREEKDNYHLLVWGITDRQYREHFYNITDACKRGNDFHLDHIYSISKGFKNNIPPEIIGNVTNLRIIPAKQNLSKSSKCDKTIQELYRDYNLFKTSPDS